MTKPAQKPIPRSEFPLTSTKPMNTGRFFGAKLAEYTVKKPGSGLRSTMIFLFIITVAFLTTAAVLLLYGSSIHGVTVGNTWSRPFLNAGIFSFVVWVLVLPGCIKRQQSISLHEKGIILKQTRKPNMYLNWKEIAGIYFWQDDWRFILKKVQRHSGLINPNHGKTISLNVYCPQQNIPELVTRLKSRFYSYLEPELRKKLREGKMIYFGPIGFSSYQITVHKEIYNWQLVKKMDMRKGQLILSLHEQKVYKIELKTIPNFELLFPLIQMASGIA